MKNLIKKMTDEKKKEQLAKDFSEMLKHADRYFDNDNKVVKYHISLHILSKKDIDVDIEDIYKIIRERVVINNGAIDYTTKGNILDLDAKLKFSGYFHYDQNNSITFLPMYREHFEDEYRHQRDLLERNAVTSFRLPVQNIRKRREFFPDHLFIYVAEKKKIYDGYKFVTTFLSEFHEKTFYYKGSIEYNLVQHLNVLKSEVM